MVDRTGEQFGNYRLVRLLGRGGFADVYLGEHGRLKTHAAIKILSTQLAGKEEDLFFKEAYTIAHLEHQHIVRILDFDVKEGMPFLVMSYAAAGTLRQRHPKGTILTAATILPYLQQVTEALQYAHDQKIIHRDIKPENMLLSKDGKVLLSDFGLALVLRSSLQSTQEVAGTVSYMAPEQLQGHPRAASDQYALGVVVYQWLCGSYPFQGSFTEIASQHVLTPPPSLRTKQSSISPAIEQVVMTTLAKDPQQRFASVREFCSAFEHACHDQTALSPVNITMRSNAPLPGSTTIPPAGQLVFSSMPMPPTDQTPSSQRTEAFQPPSPPAQVPLQRQSPSPVTPGAPPASHMSSSSSPIGSRKMSVSRRVALGVMVIAIVALGGIGLTWLSTSTAVPDTRQTTTIIIGPIQSVNAATHSVEVKVSGQVLTIDGLTDAEIAQLQANVGKTYTFQVTQNAYDSYTIIKGSKIIAEQSTATQQTTTWVTGTIQFTGRIDSVSSSTIVVQMPDGPLTMSITPQTELSGYNGNPPAVGQLVNVAAVASNGSFIASKLQPANQGDAASQNIVLYQGVTTSPVGTDNILHLAVGNKAWSFTINSATDLSRFNNNAQSIQANQTVRVMVQFNGSNGTVLKIASAP
jgi:serine/threonine protein kinase